MNVQIAALCDAANTGDNGKLNILGVFDQVFGPKEPLIHPSCTLAVKMQFERIEEGTKALKILIVDSDGKEVCPAIGGNVIVKTLPGLRTGSIQIVGTIQQLTLPRFGEYSIDIALDGTIVASVPLYARPLPQPPQLPQ
jgi:hypothetical protein